MAMAPVRLSNRQRVRPNAASPRRQPRSLLKAARTTTTRPLTNHCAWRGPVPRRTVPRAYLPRFQAVVDMPRPRRVASQLLSAREPRAAKGPPPTRARRSCCPRCRTALLATRSARWRRWRSRRRATPDPADTASQNCAQQLRHALWHPRRTPRADRAPLRRSRAVHRSAAQLVLARRRRRVQSSDGMRCSPHSRRHVPTPPALLEAAARTSCPRVLRPSQQPARPYMRRRRSPLRTRLHRRLQQPRCWRPQPVRPRPLRLPFRIKRGPASAPPP